MRNALVVAVFLSLTGSSVLGVPPTPTCTPVAPAEPPPTPLGPPGSPLQSTEPYVAIFPYRHTTWGQRALVYGNYNVFALYDLPNAAAPQLLSKQSLPNPNGYTLIGDPVVAWSPNQSAHAAAIALNAGNTNSILVWNSTTYGDTWSPPVHVIDYVAPAYGDKPWLSISSAGRMWLVWSQEVTAGGRCVATSVDNGLTWSGCVPPIANAGPSAPAIAATGPDTATIVWPDPNIEAVRCTANGLSISCSAVEFVATHHPAPGIPNLRAPSFPAVSADEVSSAVTVVWGEEAPGGGTRIVRSYSTAAGIWSATAPIYWPDTDQVMPAISNAYAYPGDVVVTFYNRDTNDNSFLKLVGYQWRQKYNQWDFLGQIGDPVNINTEGHFIGDYHGTACPPQSGACVIAFTGTNNSTNGPEIKVTSVVPFESSCSLAGQPRARSCWILFAPVLFLALLRRWETRSR